jgi:hypothetical protein
VLVALAKVLESRISAAGQGELAGTALALAGSADAKHIQMYFTDPPAEAAVTRAGWSGSMAPPAGTTDLLAVSNAMVVPAKTNVVTSKTVDYSVALRADGSADTTLVLGYVNHAPADFVVSTSVFGDYVRVYRSPGTTMAAGPSGEASGSGMTVDIGLPAVARGFQLLRGMTHVETIETLVPGAWRTGAAPASPGSDVPTGSVPPAGVAHYRLFVVRQADLEDVPTVISVTAPAGWRVTSVVAWAAASGATVPATENGSAARLSVPLATDLVLDVGLKAAS